MSKEVENIIDKFFEDNPNSFVQHHTESYNDFFNSGINRIFAQKNPIRIMREQDDKTKDFALKCNLWLGGKKGDKLYFGKPVIYDEDRAHFMYPNEARLRNMTYASTIHYDVEVEYFINEKNPQSETPTHTTVIEKVFLGRFPIMLMSDLCLLKGFTPQVRFELGECRNDRGGYFIIDGKEKCIVSQEKFADNTLYVRDKVNEVYSHSSEIRSVSEDPSKPIRTLQVRIVSPNAKYTNKQIVVNVPNVRKPVPLFILMRALGVQSDKDIINFCLHDMDKYNSYVDLFIPSIYDAGQIFDRDIAIDYIASLTKGKTTAHALEILSDYLLPHVGVMNFREKAFYLGHMVKELLKVYTKEKKPTDRDSFNFKRVELPGSLIYDLFNEYYSLQQRDIFKKIDKAYHYDQINFSKDINFINLVSQDNFRDYFSERIVEAGFKRAFKGNWGAQAHTKRLGVLQDLNRLTYNSAISHLRKINLDMDASAKVVAPRLLHSSQFGMIDPLDTPDGGNVGLHKHMSIAAYVTSGYSMVHIVKWLSSNDRIKLKILSTVTPRETSSHTKLFVNGRWIGIVSDPVTATQEIKDNRRSGLIPAHTSVSWNISDNVINIYTDSGRLCRPIFFIEEGSPSYKRDGVNDRILNNKFSWKQLTGGFAEKKRQRKNNYECLAINELYNTDSIHDLKATQAVVEYIDTAETETSLIAMSEDKIKTSLYTHMEIHPALVLGVMGNQVVFPENNPLPRDLFACGQMRQAVSLYHSNFQTRIDKMGVVLNNGQVPLVKSRFLKKINNEEHPYGENLIVAIMCYNGYNVEDSILFNEGSVKRGMFRTTYYNSYEDREDSSKVGETQVDSRFANVESENVGGLKPGFHYGELDDSGLIRENTPLDDKTVLIGKIITDLATPDKSSDASVFPKKGQHGFVDKSFVTEGEEGFRIAKVRVRDERVPNIGDKFCSRCGQKGTIGLIIPEESMPFTDDGLRPDIIINPHALPSRMTIGQLVETQMGKASAILGGFGDCTAFMNKGPKHEMYGNILTEAGYNSSGCQMMYNGESGQQIEANIYIGPTYYMRLKHMVKDKINYRARGPRTALTRQTVQGRANDGGLRIGEMERDGIASHGAALFLQESMLVRGDEYYMAVCNQTGMIAIYNDSYNLFLSPYVDGPIKYSGTLEDGMKIETISKHGRSFSVIRIPYTFKLLMQELQTMNVQMRIITDKNIDQLSSMSFSNNISKLLGGEATAQNVADSSRKLANAPDLVIPVETSNVSDGMENVSNAPVNTNDSRVNPTDIGWYLNTNFDDETIWNSLIMDENGMPTETWFNEANKGEDPIKPPVAWRETDAVYQDGSRIPDKVLSVLLRENSVPNNWSIAIGAAKQSMVSVPNISDVVVKIPPTNEPESPLFEPGSISPQYNPESPPYNPESPTQQQVSPPFVITTPPEETDKESEPSVDEEKEVLIRKIDKVQNANSPMLTTIDVGEEENEEENTEKKNIKLN